MKTNILILVLFSVIILTACLPEKNNWPRGMTPFFAECEYEGKVYTDKAYLRKKRAGGCERGEFKYYDRGEPTLTN
jgi:hypothetical protein|tara:strand:+ start:329 stop:556 length:228 start_codon:yes stop_codon:yes gene_type:complete